MQSTGCMQISAARSLSGVVLTLACVACLTLDGVDGRMLSHHPKAPKWPDTYQASAALHAASVYCKCSWSSFPGANYALNVKQVLYDSSTAHVMCRADEL